MGYNEEIDSWDVSFTGSKSFAKTSKGNEFAIFNSIISAIREFIETRNPPAFHLEADGDASRVRLYNRFAKLVKKTPPFSKYDVKIEGGGTNASYYFYK